MKPDVVESAIKEKFPNDYIGLQGDEWLVAAKGTAKEVSDTLGITGEATARLGSAIVFATTGYFGRAPTEVWEWIRTKTEATGG
jgi:hypothetical protein